VTEIRYGIISRILLKTSRKEDLFATGHYLGARSC
jgi:hypothetical protein